MSNAIRMWEYMCIAKLQSSTRLATETRCFFLRATIVVAAVVVIVAVALGLFGSRAETHQSSNDRFVAVDVGVLLHHVESYPGIIIFITNTPRAIDKAFHRRVRFALEFTMPEPSLRTK